MPAVTSHFTSEQSGSKGDQLRQSPGLVLLRPAEGAAVAEVKSWEREAGWACPRKAKVLIILWCSAGLPMQSPWIRMD